MSWFFNCQKYQQGSDWIFGIRLYFELLEGERGVAIGQVKILQICNLFNYLLLLRSLLIIKTYRIIFASLWTPTLKKELGSKALSG